MVATGDIMLARPPLTVSNPDEPNSIQSLLSDADIALANLENVLVDATTFDGHPKPNPDGAWLVGHPSTAETLRAAGFDILSLANNHAGDLGFNGLKKTADHLKQSGLKHSGTGQNLTEARSPAVFEKGKMDVAMISATVSFPDRARAKNAPGNLSQSWSHPGVFGLRVKRFLHLGKSRFEGLKTYLKSHPLRQNFRNSKSRNVLNIFGVHFREGTQKKYSYQPNANDLRIFMKSIKQADRNHDLVIVSLHAHQPGNWSDKPADFIRTVAHRAVEAGADKVFGHGPHRLRGIEIYQSSPILYSLGNFAFQFEQFQPRRVDAYARSREETNRKDITLPRKIYEKLGINKRWYEGVIARTRFRDEGFQSLVLHPISLGYDHNGPRRGRPRLAQVQKAQSILKRLKGLSEDFGTTVEIKSNRGFIRND
ncbi:MAG: CapA family protein [bacterium]